HHPDLHSFPTRRSSDLRYLEFWAAVARTYVDNSWVIRVPFFGFSFDVNDLGLLGGIGFLTILVCLRFCLSRELNNLRLSFDVARDRKSTRLNSSHDQIS